MKWIWMACLLPAVAWGQERDRVDAAVDRGIAFLLTQQREDGAINDVEKRSDNSNAMTGLAIMALASAGHMPTDPTPEGKALARALEFILGEKQQEANGYFGKADGSRMYGHGIVTLMLAEMAGMGVDDKQDRLIRSRCQKALDLIVRSQLVKKEDAKYEGGWRYGMDSQDADLSVTVWQVMALRAAKNAGLTVPKEAIDKAVGYIKRSYMSKRDEHGRPTEARTGFGYQPGHKMTYSTSAEGLLALQVCGEYDAPEVLGAAEWLANETPQKANKWFFYGTYYYAQGMYQRGGAHAEKARPAVESAVIARQQKDGSWKGEGQEEGRVYATSLAILSLSVKYHYMPIYQR